MGDVPDVTPERTTVDGVPVFSLSIPGLMHANLIFRVGRADETLTCRGITHLVEHMALHSRANRSDWWRSTGSVEAFVTRFSVRGEPRDISTFLFEVTSSLSELPMDRLRAEKAILRTEAANSGPGSIKEMWSHRFGARGLGVLDYLEFGLRWLGTGEVRAWAEERFNAGNAALWISGPLPADLHLNLRPGERFPRPVAEPLRNATPAFYRQGDSGVALSMLASGGGGSIAYVLRDVLEDRIRRRLRHDEGIAYDASVHLHGAGRGMTAITAFADALAENAEQAAASLIDIVEDLATRGHQPDEIEALLASTRAANQEPGAAFESLNDAAFFELGAVNGFISRDDFDKEVRSLTAADIARYTESAFSTALLAIPEGVACDIKGFDPLPGGNGLAFEGIQVVASPGAGHDEVIDYSDDGMSIRQTDGTTNGVRWKEIAAALWWKDGTRAVIGLDGTAFRVVPEKWLQSEALLEAIRVSVPHDRWVPMDEPIE